MSEHIKDGLISRQVTLAKDLLHRCEVVDVRCILAGGALRSWIIDNKPARDLDIYIRTTTCNETWVKRFIDVVLYDYNLVKYEQLGAGDRLNAEYRTTKNKDHLLSVYDCVFRPFDINDENNGDYNIQFMFIRTDTTDILRTFTNSMCKIYGKDTSNLVRLPENQILVNKGRVRLLNEFVLSDFIKTMFVDDITSKHTYKMKLYYPNHKVMHYDDMMDYINTTYDLCGDAFFDAYFEHEKMIEQRIVDFNNAYRFP